jgi:hypothetical protein
MNLRRKLKVDHLMNHVKLLRASSLIIEGRKRAFIAADQCRATPAAYFTITPRGSDIRFQPAWTAERIPGGNVVKDRDWPIARLRLCSRDKG